MIANDSLELIHARKQAIFLFFEKRIMNILKVY